MGCGVGGCWEPWRGCWAGRWWVPWGGFWEPRRGRLVGWCGVPWGWVLGAAEVAVGGVVWGAGGVGAGSRGGPK